MVLEVDKLTMGNMKTLPGVLPTKHLRSGYIAKRRNLEEHTSQTMINKLPGLGALVRIFEFATSTNYGIRIRRNRVRQRQEKQTERALRILIQYPEVEDREDKHALKAFRKWVESPRVGTIQWGV